MIKKNCFSVLHSWGEMVSIS